MVHLVLYVWSRLGTHRVIHPAWVYTCLLQGFSLHVNGTPSSLKVQSQNNAGNSNHTGNHAKYWNSVEMYFFISHKATSYGSKGMWFSQ